MSPAENQREALLNEMLECPGWRDVARPAFHAFRADLQQRLCGTDYESLAEIAADQALWRLLARLENTSEAREFFLGHAP